MLSYFVHLRYFSASNAAIHPLHAAIIACLYVLSCTSPAANTPGTLVLPLGEVMMYPFGSTVICPLRNSVLGVWPIA